MLLAFREARRCQNDFLGTEHVLFGLLCESSGPVATLLRSLGALPEQVQGRVQEMILDDQATAALERFPLSPAVRRAIEHAGQEAAQLGQSLIGPEHLLLGLLREDGSQAAQVLADCNVTLTAIRPYLAQLSPAEQPDHLLLPGTRTHALQPAEADPTAESLQALVATMVPAQATESEGGGDVLVVGGTPRQPRELVRYVAAVESQLRMTQLVFGGMLGFALGYAMSGLECGALLGLGGLAVAALRSSLMGTLVGLGCGLMLSPLAGHEFDDRWHGSRLLLGLIGALLGSFLGDFWRRPVARLTEESPPGDDPEDGNPRS
jgi:ATP-dependent Clp protease ATP-binding subunit ClpC